jgi:hypothetical protein
MYSKIAVRVAARDCSLRRNTSSCLSVPKKLSETALSQQSALRLMLRSTLACETVCLGVPWSVMGVLLATRDGMDACPSRCSQHRCITPRSCRDITVAVLHRSQTTWRLDRAACCTVAHLIALFALQGRCLAGARANKPYSVCLGSKPDRADVMGSRLRVIRAAAPTGFRYCCARGIPNRPVGLAIKLQRFESLRLLWRRDSVAVGALHGRPGKRWA